VNSARLKKGIASVAAVAVLFVGFVGFLHTPAGRKLPMGRRLLSLMHISCPINFKKLTTGQVEYTRRYGMNAIKGTRATSVTPSLIGLELNQTTERGAQTWASNSGLKCESLVRGLHYLKCENVSPNLIRYDGNVVVGTRPIQALTLAFSPTEKLIAVDVFRRQLPPAEAANVMQSVSENLDKKLGKPTESFGALTAAHLGGQTMKTAFCNYRFKNYVALLTAQNIPWSGGVVVHEQYSSAAK
jgi:hypothetical protein